MQPGPRAPSSNRLPASRRWRRFALRADGFVLEVAQDGSAARVERDGKIVAALAPLVHRDGVVPRLKVVRKEPSVRLEGESVALEIAVEGRQIAVSIDSQEPCEGPVLRALSYLYAMIRHAV